MIESLKERIARELAWVLPRRVVYWCAIRVWAAGTTGIYSNEPSTRLNFLEALQRFERWR